MKLGENNINVTQARLCPGCNQPFEAGDDVHWPVKGEPPVHVNCDQPKG